MRNVWLPRALDQLLEIVAYIDEDNPSAAAEASQQIRTRCDTPAKYPLRRKDNTTHVKFVTESGVP